MRSEHGFITGRWRGGVRLGMLLLGERITIGMGRDMLVQDPRQGRKPTHF
ncbi:MAG: hypothetical protein OEW09_15070 [Anaerolineae bacterium]|nr:hypothetical protein [Anaerolineae bacterium]